MDLVTGNSDCMTQESDDIAIMFSSSSEVHVDQGECTCYIGDSHALLTHHSD